MNQPKRGENRVNTAVSPMRGWRLEGMGGRRKGLLGGLQRQCHMISHNLLICFVSLPPSFWLSIHSTQQFYVPGSSLVAMVGIGENAALLCHNLRY